MCMKMTLIYTICAGCACQTIVSGFKSGKILARKYICIWISFFFTEYALSLCRLKRDYKSWKINCTIYIYMYCYLYFVHKIGLVQQHNSDRYRPRGATQAIHDGRVAALTMLRLLLSRRVPPFHMHFVVYVCAFKRCGIPLGLRVCLLLLRDLVFVRWILCGIFVFLHEINYIKHTLEMCLRSFTFHLYVNTHCCSYDYIQVLRWFICCCLSKQLIALRANTAVLHFTMRNADDNDTVLFYPLTLNVGSDLRRCPPTNNSFFVAVFEL